MKMGRLAFLAVLVLAVCAPHPASAVPAVAYGTTNIKILAFSVQDAVNKAANSNFIFLSEGAFYEAVVVSNKSLFFEGGWDTNVLVRTGGYTTIDGSNAVVPLTFYSSSTRVDSVHLVHGAGIWGGGCLLKQNSWVEFAGSSLSSNGAVFAGGGLYVDGGSYAKLTGASRVFTNVAISIGAGAWGGGIFIESSGRVDIVHEDADVFGNAAIDGNGGGIWVGDYGYLRLFQADVFRNVAISGPVSIASAGGGIGASTAFIEAGDGAEVYGNEAVMGGGLALVLSTAQLGRARIKDFLVHGNVATQGGGLYAISSTIASYGTFWATNRAAAEGGGLYLANTDFLGDTNRSDFFANRAAGHGGGIYASGSGLGLYESAFGEAGRGNLSGGSGGGIYASNTPLYVLNCRFVANSATNPAGGGGSGGAIAAFNSYLGLNNVLPLPGTATQMVFEANAAATNNGRGGAVYLLDGQLTSSVMHCVFRSNDAFEGGAVYAGNSAVYTYFSTFTLNRARSEGGAICGWQSEQMLWNCRLAGNAADGHGGAVYDQIGTFYAIHSGFRDNWAGGSGGAIAALDSKAVWASGTTLPFYSPANGWPSFFEGNTASQYAGAVHAQLVSNVYLQQTAFLSNSAGFGDGVYAYQSGFRADHSVFSGQADYAIVLSASTGAVLNCTIANNGFAAFRLDDAHVAISNTILWGHIQPFQMFDATAEAGYSDIQGGMAGPGNLNQDPRLYSNLHLKAGSPCINAGIAGGAGSDIDNDARSGAWDIGCDEFLDTDGDRLPDIVESSTGTWASEWNTGTDPNNPESDGDHMADGDEWLVDTDPNDPESYLGFARIWLENGEIRYSFRSSTNTYREINLDQDLNGTNWFTTVSWTAGSGPAVATNSEVPQGPRFYRGWAHR